MKTTRKPNEYLVFWQTLAKGAKDKVPTQTSLANLAKKYAGTPFGAVVTQVLQAVSDGQPWADALRVHSAVFPAVLVTLVRAGASSGMLDVVLDRIVEGLSKGTFVLPNQKADPAKDEVRFWQAFHLLISCGVPVLSALESVRDGVVGKPLREATQKLIESISQGTSLSEGMRAHPSVFKPEICEAIAVGERSGKVDEVALNLAQALEAGDLSSLRVTETPPDDVQSAEAAPVIRIVNQILVESIKQRATDIHLELTANGKVWIRFRIDGVLKEIDPFPAALWPQVVSRIKICSDLDVAQHRMPQDGRFQIKALDKQIDMKVSVAPTVTGEKIVMRLLDRSSVQLALRDLGLDPDDLEKMLALVHQPSGMVICSGPTGSGKTTTLYALVQEVNHKENSVMTVEDPVEYILDGVAQVAVKVSDGITFSRAMRMILRQDPDVIMVGELRDLETLQVSVQAALTGHLILTTLHSNDSVDTLKRMMEMGLEPFMLNAGLAGIIAQRLVRKLCSKCKQEYEPVRNQLPPEVLAMLAKNPGAKLYRPQGCDACNKGYKGRAAIHEILVMNEAVSRLVGPSMEASQVLRAARQNGMKTLLESGMGKVIKGITSLEEVMRVAPCGGGL